MRRRKTLPEDPGYKVITISMYNEDLHALDAMVDTLKKRGVTNASRSGLIRFALNNIDLDSIEKI